MSGFIVSRLKLPKIDISPEMLGERVELLDLETTHPNLFSLSTADIDGNGYIDLVIGEEGGTLFSALNQGDGTFIVHESDSQNDLRSSSETDGGESDANASEDTESGAGSQSAGGCSLVL